MLHSRPCSPEGLIRNLETFSFLFWSAVNMTLKIYAQSFGGKLFHYQDYKNREIDAVIVELNKDWCAFEIKLGAIKSTSLPKTWKTSPIRLRKEGESPKTLSASSVAFPLGLSTRGWRLCCAAHHVARIKPVDCIGDGHNFQQTVQGQSRGVWTENPSLEGCRPEKSRTAIQMTRHSLNVWISAGVFLSSIPSKTISVPFLGNVMSL